MNRAIAKILIVLGVSGILVSTASAQQFINVLTGGTSGIYYPIGVALSGIYSKAVPEAKSTVQATKASVENLNLLQVGRGEVALTLGDSLSAAWAGNKEAGFKAPLKKLRGISAMYTNYIQIVARADSGIKTLADIKGKRVSVGAPKSGTELNARAVFSAAGLKYADFSKVEYLPYAESVELLKNRQIDVTLQSAGLGNPALRDVAAAMDVVFVPVPADVISKIGDAAYVSGTIPAGTYKGQNAPVPTASVVNFLVTHEGVSADVVYRMTKGMYQSLDQLAAAHAAAKGVKLENAARSMPIPLHPGAEKYYREVGLIK
ncbi:MAG: C4-dicarboxylate ABC transporter [Nitrospirae bacterium RBG_16_64_22]|nr:MAG: C4-dicarboxylate ABC transporter [Nitrospirae bacterium RBG_16_64_22]